MKLCAWFKKQLFGNELDELQQQKADQIGHRGFWLAWALLLIALLIQSIAGADMTQMAAEWSIFMILWHLRPDRVDSQRHLDDC